MTQFEGFDEHMNCEMCDIMLPEAVDGTLTPMEQKAFDRHMVGCTRCSQELAEARRGAAWLSMLKTKAPEPPAGLLERILAETSGMAVPVVQVQAAPVWIPEVSYQPVVRPAQGGWSSRWSAARMKLSEVFSIDNASTMFQPRMAMTAAMAFFSFALTMNMMGVRLSDVRASNFTPSGIRRTVADTGASASRSVMNMRVVYQMESRVSELRNDDRH
jgi:anti-sigma factor RsiW